MEQIGAPSSAARHHAAPAQPALHCAEADQFPPLLIPQAEGQRFKAGKQRHRFDRLKQRLSSVAFLEVVVRDAGAEMMNVMVPDVAGEPLQDFWQFVERTALERRGAIIPIRAPLPINALKL